MKNSNEQKMFKGISRWKKSGLTQKAWCAKNHVVYATFHYWYKRYREQLSTDQGEKDGFVQLMVDSPIAAWCELALPDGKKLVFHQPVGAEFIKTLID